MSILDFVADIHVAIGFGSDAAGGIFLVLDDPVKGELDDASHLLAPDTVFVDVTEHVKSVTIDRGRERELDEYSTGVATIVFNDNDRTFDPAYDGSPYFGQLMPMKRVSIYWHNIDLFTGWVDDWTVTYEPGDTLSRVTAECVDGFAILANQELLEISPAHSGDLAGERISRVLDLDEVQFPASRSIDEGNSTLGATTFGENALGYIQACSRAEGGYLFVAADGTLTFRGRTAVLNPTEVDVLLTDDGESANPSHIAYQAISQRSSADLLYTRVTGQSETTGNPSTSVDTSAVEDFFIRTLDLGTLFTINDPETANLVDFHLERFSTPELRFQSATIDTAGLDEEQVVPLVSLELTDVIYVNRSPLDVGSMVSRLSLIDGISHNITAGSWTVGLNFANTETRAFLKLDDTVFGVLNSNRLAF